MDPVSMHGDYHPGNLIYRNNGSIGVIDFHRWEVGDPYEEFYKLESFGIEHSIPYSIGQIDTYFDNHIPQDFWITLSVYVAHTSVSSIRWAETFGQEKSTKWQKYAAGHLKTMTIFKASYQNGIHEKNQTIVFYHPIHSDMTHTPAAAASDIARNQVDQLVTSTINDAAYPHSIITLPPKTNADICKHPKFLVKKL